MRLICCLLIAMAFFACDEPVGDGVKVIEALPDSREGLELYINQNPDDESKLKAYWKLYKTIRSVSPGQAISYLGDMQSLAARLGHDDWMGKAYFGKAYIQKQQGDYHNAIAAYLVAAEIFGEAGSESSLALVLNNIGSILITIGDYEYAIQFLEKANQIHINNNDVENQVLTNMNLGTCYFNLNMPAFDKADNYYQNAIALNSALPEKQDFYFNTIYNLLGAMHYKHREYDKAIADYTKSMEYAQLLPEYPEKPYIAMINIGETFIGQGLYQRAIYKLEKALSYAEDNNILGKNVVEGYNMLATAHQKMGNIHEARQAVDNAVRIANKEIINPALQRSLQLLGEVYDADKKSGQRIDEERLYEAFNLRLSQDQLKQQLSASPTYADMLILVRKEIQLNAIARELDKAEAENKFRQYFSFSLTLLVLLGLVFIFHRRLPFTFYKSEKTIAYGN